MILYLDCCCYNRPFDARTQEKVYMEGEAILTIINKNKKKNNKIIGSPALDFEIEQISDFVKREKVRSFYEQTVNEKVDYNDNILEFANKLSRYTNIKPLDRIHLSFAANSWADVLLTTDYKFEKAAAKLNMKTRVINPLSYLMEVI